MPWSGYEPPDVPEDNPTGIYQKVINISASSISEMCILHIGSAESLVLVFVMAFSLDWVKIVDSQANLI